MSIPFQIGGARTVIPGVYSEFFVQNSLPAPVPAGRSVLILGEADEGIPGSELDLRLNFFTSFQDVRDFYSDGDIVDAARMLFSNQPSPQFTGAIQRLYVYKTNDSTRAERDLEGPTGYGALVAARFGESGNLIKTEVVESQAETKPSKTFDYIPQNTSRDIKVMVNGELNTISVAGLALASDLQTLIDAIPGVTATTAQRTTFLPGSSNMDLASSGDELTLTLTGAEVWSEIEAGDIGVIFSGSALAGASDENVGAYKVTSAGDKELRLRQVYHATGFTDPENVTSFDTTSVTGATTSDFSFHSPFTITVDASTDRGTCASLELLDVNADKQGAGLFMELDDYKNLLLDSTSSIASISASVPAAGELLVELSTGAWATTPKAGDLVRIARGSLLAGATDKNVGYFLVKSSGSKSLTLTHLYAGMTTEAVAASILNGANDTLTWDQGFVSTSTSARRIDSSAERKVSVEATRESDGASTPGTAIGGNCVFEIGYYDAAATACTLTIDSQRRMTITPTGAGSAFTVPLRKYDTLSELVTFLNTQDGITAKVSTPQNRSLSVDVLDQVTGADILDGQATPAYNGKIKKDYHDWGRFFEDNFGLLTWRAGGLSEKAGLPDADTNAQFLDGATLGSTSSAAVQSGLDAGLKIDVRHVIPLFSRDAAQDILDGLTDPDSGYSIDAIHASVRSHVATASSTLNRKRRFGMLSFDGSFEDSKTKVGEVSFERCQMTFQRHGATSGLGDLETFLPWISACAAAAGRSQAVLGTSLLRKPLLLSSAEHYGETSLFTSTLNQDFDPDDRGQLEEAIEAGLLTLRAVQGFGVRVESPDLSTRSRENDPKAWVFERVNVQFTIDEVLDTVERTLENFIGERQSDVPVAVVRQAIENVLRTFRVGTGNGSLLAASVTQVRKVGTTYEAELELQPVEAIEAIKVTALATRPDAA